MRSDEKLPAPGLGGNSWLRGLALEGPTDRCVNIFASDSCKGAETACGRGTVLQ